MGLRAAYQRHDLKFTFTAITSRQLMTVKETYFITVWDEACPEVKGIGECAVFRGLGADDTPDYEQRVAAACREINRLDSNDIKESSICFGVETALKDLENGGEKIIFPSAWQRGEEMIEINGLVWMGDRDTMARRMREKVDAGFRCVKLKIGGIDFQQEIELLRQLREEHGPELEIRLDANGGFSPREALHKLERLARYDIHSIEQPIRAGQWREMREITCNSPVDIALDEELIGKMGYDDRCRLLDATMPRYIILKPSLHGGFSTSDGWIKDATDREIDWWATSALESNIGLNAIAQWASSHRVTMPQGLGTGALYSNNIESPLTVVGSRLKYATDKRWGPLP